MSNGKGKSVFVQDIENQAGTSNPFLQDIASQGIASSYDQQFFEPVTFTGWSGVGESMFDDRSVPYSELDNLQDIRAKRQPWLAKTGAGVLRVLGETAVNILQMPGYVGGALGALGNEVFGDGEGSMDIFLNNWWVDSLEDAKEYLTSEIAPVYVKKSVEEGGFWKNVGSMDFWATEGASGLAFLLSALAPGAAISKLGTGAKLATALGKSGQRGLSMLEKADDWAAKVGLSNLDNATNVVGATVGNTLYEAGVEADSALESYRNNVEGLYKEGLIDRNKYDSLMAEAPKQAAKVFRDNVGILLVPNLVMSKALFGRAIPKNQLDAFKSQGGKIIPEIAELSTRQKITRALDPVGKALVSEGLIEEGGQMTSEIYHTEGYLDSFMEGSSQKSMAETYLDMLGTTEGQKAMFLGTFFGTGAYAFGNHRAKKAKNEQRAKLAELMTSGVNFFESATGGIYQKNEDGSLALDDDGNPIPDKAKAAELGAQVDYINTLNNYRETYRALAETGVEGAQEKADLLDRTILNNMLYSFAHAGEDGMSVLKNHLENSPGVSALLEGVNQGRPKPKQKGEFVSEIMKEAEALRADVEYYSKYGEFKNRLIDNQKDLPYYDKYSSLVKNKYAAAKSNLRYLDIAKNETQAALAQATQDLIDQANIPQEDLDFVPKGDIITKLENKIKAIDELITDNKDELKGLFDAKKQKALYTKFKKNEQKREQAEEDSKELDELLDVIRSQKSPEDIDSVVIPKKFQTGNSQKAINTTKREAKELLSRTRQANKEGQREATAEQVEAEKDKITEAQRQSQFIKDNYQVGEQVPIDDLDVPEGFDTFKEVTPDGVTLTNEAGETYTLDSAKFYSVAYDPETQYSSEDTGGTEVYDEKERVDSQVRLERNKDARIAITDNKKEGPVRILFPDLQEAYQFEISPSDKRGYYGIEINEAATSNSKSLPAQAVVRLEKEGVTADNIEFLVDNLPLNIKLTDTIGAPLENKTKGDTKVFNDTTAKLKRTILKELQDGTPMSAIEIEIKGQYGGRIQTETRDGLPAENNIKDLYYFAGDIANVKVEDIYIVNDIGELENTNGDKIGTKRDLARGEIYIKIQTANGTEFPLKLNVSKIDVKTADFLYELYKERFDTLDTVEEGQSTKSAKLKPELLERFKNEFPEVWSIFDNQEVDETDLTIKDVIDFFIFDNTSNIKSRVLFNKGQLKIGPNIFNRDEFSENKQGFIDALTSVKRQHVRFKKHPKHIANLSLTNREYLEYLVKNRILNTNASTVKEVFEGDQGVSADPIFKDRTTMYMATNTVKVNGELSKHNEVKEATFAPSLFGNNKALKKVFPRLFELDIELSADEKFYVDKHDNKYKRATSLVPFTGEPMEEANTRGNVVDLLLRDFFSPLQELSNFSRFFSQGIDYLEKQNKKNGTDVDMDEGFFESLFDTFIEFADMFQEEGLTVYSNVPAVKFKMGDELYAGTPDLVTYNNKTGEWGIIDLKTSRQDREVAYDGQDKYNYKGKDLKQQNAYREGFRQTAGLEVGSLKIMPLRVNPASKSNYLGSTVATSSSKLLDVSMEKTIFEILNKKETAPKIEVDEFQAQTNELAEMEKDPDLDDWSDMLEYAGVETAEQAPTPAPKKNTANTGNRKQQLLRAKAQYEKNEFVDIAIIIGGETKRFTVTNPIFGANKTAKAGLIVLNRQQEGKPGFLVTDYGLYQKVIKGYNEHADEVAKLGYKVVKIGPKTTKAFFDIIVGESAPVQKTEQQKPLEPKKPTTPKQKAVAKKVEKVEKKAESFLDKITEENHKQVLKALKSKGFISPSNLKAVGQINSQYQGAQKVRKIVEFLVSEGANKEQIIKNCIV